jgi:hypothetical protein
VAGPPAAQPEELADLRAEQRPDRRDQIRTAALGSDPGDRVPGLRIGEGDPLEDPVQYRAGPEPPWLPTVAGMKSIFIPNGRWCLPAARPALPGAHGQVLVAILIGFAAPRPIRHVLPEVLEVGTRAGLPRSGKTPVH